jgi:hypothetical protein
MTSQGDFNHDGTIDLLLHFRTQDLKLVPGATGAVLCGETTTGPRIRGADSVRLLRFVPVSRSGVPATRTPGASSSFRPN